MADSPEHEAKCQRCGVSCHAAVPIDDGRQIVVEGLHCKHLGILGDGLPGCKVYHKRFEVAPWCLHSSVGDSRLALREGCPYQTNVFGKGKEWVSPKEYEELWPKVVEALFSAKSANPYFTWKKFIDFAEKMDPAYKWRAKPNAARTCIRLSRKLTIRAKAKAWLRLSDQHGE